jgi:hypothetical protein
MAGRLQLRRQEPGDNQHLRQRAARRPDRTITDADRCRDCPARWKEPLTPDREASRAQPGGFEFRLVWRRLCPHYGPRNIAVTVLIAMLTAGGGVWWSRHDGGHVTTAVIVDQFSLGGATPS